MASTEGFDRTKSFGDGHQKTLPEKFGHWLSNYQVSRAVPSFQGLHVGDFGCGFEAEFLRPHLGEVAQATLVDVTLADDLKTRSNVLAIEGTLPDALFGIPDASLDFILCNNILEHLVDPLRVLVECRRIVKPTGVSFFNVPSWRGKHFLELLAFKLHWTVESEIDDHKNYYEPEDLWRMLVQAGFRPRDIACRKHKFGLNTFAVCKPGS